MARRPSPTSQPRWARRAAASQTPPKQRPKLTAEDVEKLKALMKERFDWDEDPRLFQIQGTQAQLEGSDMIIQAPTGSGKTAVAAGPHVWPASAGKTTIMVCPLLALEEEMVETFRDDFGLSAVAVNSAGGKLTNELVKELLAGIYQIILISPEMLQSPTFINRVLRRPEFAQRILSVVVDEAHCVSHWGADFRKKYSSLGIIRAFLPRGTPIIAVTATLTARVRRDLHRVHHFPRTGSRFINLGNDRPNVSIVVRACEHPQNSYADLDFILPLSITSPTDIPKTYLYVDDIRVGSEIIDYLNVHLTARAPSLAHQGLIRPFNATLSHEYRRAAMKAFRAQPLSSTGDHDPTAEPSSSGEQCIRVLVCTDAAGMGCNVGDVDLVVQWKLPKTLSSFVQRAGRAARFKNRTGLAVLLVERSAYSVDLRSTVEAPTAAHTTGKASKGKVRKTRGAAAPKGYAKEHGIDRGGTKKADAAVLTADPPHLDLEAPDEGLLVFVQAATCRRKIWAQVFESNCQVKLVHSIQHSASSRTTLIQPSPAPVPGVACCDICTPSLFDRCRPGVRINARKSKMPDRGHPDLQAVARLEDWREDIFARDHSTSQLDASTILDDGTIRSLTSVGSLTASQLAELLEPTWIWWPRYGRDLTTLILRMKIEYRPLPKKPKKGKTEEEKLGAKRAADDNSTRPSEGSHAGTPAKRPRMSHETDITADVANQHSQDEDIQGRNIDLARPSFPPAVAPSYPASVPSGYFYNAVPSTPRHSSELGVTTQQLVIQSPGLQHGQVYRTPPHPAAIPYYSPPPSQQPATPVRYVNQSEYAAQPATPFHGMPPADSCAAFSYPVTPSPGYATPAAAPSGFVTTRRTSTYPNRPPAPPMPLSAPPYPVTGGFSTPPVYGNSGPERVSYHDTTSAIPSYSPLPRTPSVQHAPQAGRTAAAQIHGSRSSSQVSHPYGTPMVSKTGRKHVAGSIHTRHPAYPSPAPTQFSP